MNAAIRAVLSALKDRLRCLYGQRLRGLYLFGSFARDEADAESDMDVLIVLDRVDDYAQEIGLTSPIMSELSLECGHSISCVFVSEARWGQDQTMFLLNVREEAIRA